MASGVRADRQESRPFPFGCGPLRVVRSMDDTCIQHCYPVSTEQRQHDNNEYASGAEQGGVFQMLLLRRLRGNG